MKKNNRIQNNTRTNLDESPKALRQHPTLQNKGEYIFLASSGVAAMPSPSQCTAASACFLHHASLIINDLHIIPLIYTYLFVIVKKFINFGYISDWRAMFIAAMIYEAICSLCHLLHFLVAIFFLIYCFFRRKKESGVATAGIQKPDVVLYVNLETPGGYTYKELKLFRICHGRFSYEILSYYDKEIIANRFDENTATLCRAMFIVAIIYMALICICCVGSCVGGIVFVYILFKPKKEKKVGTHKVQKPDVDQNANKIEF
ncbi:MAG: hypothetical protein MHMPM18_001850 [Marteilia pararefringens]